MELTVTAKQKQFIDADADEVLFGGAAGGGKSYAFPAYEKTSVKARMDEYDQIIRRQLDAWREKQKARLHKWH